MFTKPFKDINKADAAIAGGKGASLGEMSQAGIPVPPGFVVLSSAFEEFIKEAELELEINAQLKKANPKNVASVEKASRIIQSLILDEKIPQAIQTEIKLAFKKLGTKYVAVRSSATAEDSASAAWAGQLESFLNTTEEKLLTNVRKCWASLYTPRAIFYRLEQKLHKKKISVAVVVQKMVQSEVSGIAFSVHPVTEDYSQMIIEAGYGLGEAIVSGQITPDSYVVQKNNKKITEKNISEQSRALVRKGNANEWINLSATKSAKQKLADKEISKLAELVLKIEKHYGFPVDVEWAREKNKFYITQSRPITTLGK